MVNIDDVSTTDFEEKKVAFFSKLQNEDPYQIQNLTVSQHLNEIWYRARAERLTASNFGRICKIKSSTDTANTVKSLLYHDFQGCAATRYGIEHERTAITDFEKLTNPTTEECGLFVDAEFPYLAASPDRIVVEEDAFVEVKCPYKRKDLTPYE
jgi:hypothetical protein